MPVQDIKGLSGLKGWGQLTDEERALWLEQHPKYKGVDERKMYDGYVNQNFIDQFGRENFDRYDRHTRDAIYQSKVLDTAVRDTFKDDVNLNTILDMTPEGQMELFNSNYLEKQEKVDRRKDKNETSPLTSNKKGFDVSDVFDPLGIGRWTAKQAGEFQTNITEQSKEAILAGINAADLERKEKGQAGRSQEIRAKIISDLQTSKTSEGEINDAFNKIVKGGNEDVNTVFGETAYINPGSRVYKAYEDSHEMADFGLQDKIDALAEYQAMQEAYGTSQAMQYLDTKFQNYIADHQNAWDWFGSAAQGVATKFAANLAGIPLFVDSMLKAGNPEALANWAEGKDENGEDLPWWKNPLYWNGVDQFGSFSPEYIDKVREEYGGISKYNYLTPAGKEMNFANTMNEAVKMAGYLAAGFVVSRGLGGINGGVASLLESAGGQAVAQVLSKASPYIIGAVNAFGISEAYAIGTYEQTMQEANAEIDARRYADAEAYAQSILGKDSGLRFDNGVIEGTTKESNGVAGLLNEYVRVRTEEILKQRPDLSLDDINQDALYEEGLQQYSAVLQQQYLEEHNADYDADRDMARKASAMAYTADALLEEARMFLSNVTYRKFLMSKADRAKLVEGFPGRKAVEIDGSLVAKASNGRSMAWADASAVLRNIWGGARDNYLDDVTVAFAKGFGLKHFNDYFESGLSPQEFAASTDMLEEFWAGMAAGVSGAELSMIDKQSFHDGLVGGLGGAVTIAPRFRNIAARSQYGDYANYDKTDLANAASSRKVLLPDGKVRKMTLDEYLNNKELVDKDIKDGKVKKLNFLEIANEYMLNPLLQDYADARQRSKGFQRIVDTANKVIAENMPKVSQFVTTASLLNEVVSAEKGQNLADLKDVQMMQAIDYAGMLSEMESDPVYSQSSEVVSQKEKIQRLADGNVTEQDIADFLNDISNKSVKEGANPTEVAKERLQKNAEQLLTITEEYNKAMKQVKEDPSYAVIAYRNGAPFVAKQLTFNKLMYGNRAERMGTMEQSINHSTKVSELSNPIALYGSEQGRQDIENYQKTVIEAQTEELKAKKEELKAIRETKSRTLEGRQENKVREQAVRLSIQEIERRLSDSKAKLQEIQKAKDTDFSKVLTPNEILALNPVERAEMLKDGAKRDIDSPMALYSPAQRREIQKLRDRIAREDYSVLDMIQDSATLYERNKDVEVSNSIMKDNLIAAAMYYDHAINARRAGVVQVWTKRIQDAADNALDGLGIEQESTLKAVARQFSSWVLDDYVERHPEKKDSFTPTIELVKLGESAKGIIDRLFNGDTQKANDMKNRVNEILGLSNVHNVNDAMTGLEEEAELHRNTDAEKDWDSLLTGLQEAKYIRNVAKVAEREVRRRDDKKAAERREARKRARKEAREKKAQKEKEEEEKRKRQEEKKKELEGKSGEGIPLFNEPKEAPAQPSVAPEVKQDDFTPDGAVRVPTPQQEVDAASRDKKLFVVKPSNEEPENMDNPKKDDKGRSLFLEGEVPGNALYEFEEEFFTNSGEVYSGFTNKTLRIADRRLVKKVGGALQALYNWEDGNTIGETLSPKKKNDIQAIIDNELDSLVDNDTTIYFIHYNDSKNSGISTVIFNAIEYTDTVKSKHNKDLGGVVTATDGKEYLIIGELGYTPTSDASKVMFDMVVDSFKDHKSEDYFVNPTYRTKIGTIFSGRIVDNYGFYETGKLRTLGSLMQDKTTNPHGITYENAVFGIMRTKDGFIRYRDGKRGKQMFYPRSVENNIGLTFLMVPSSNGNYIPIAFEPAHIGELTQGSTLRNTISDAVLGLASPDKLLREQSLKDLSEYLVFTQGEQVKFTDSSHTGITIIRNAGAYVRNYDLNTPNLADTLRQEIMINTPLRVNITPATILNPARLRIWDEAGALKTTAAKLGTVNASYTVRMLDSNGNIVEKALPPSPTPRTLVPEISGTKVNYRGDTYTIAPDKNVYDKNGNQVSENVAFSVRASNYIVGQNLSPEHISKNGELKYYRINPTTVVAMDTYGQVRKLDKKQMESYNAQLEQQRKDNAASAVINNNGTPPVQSIPLPPVDTSGTPYNFKKSMVKGNSATRVAVRNFLEKRGLWKDTLKINEIQDILEKRGVSITSATNEQDFIDMLNNCVK